jgi:PAS domain S-box-containing protein
LQIDNEGFLLAVQGSNAAIWNWDIQTGEVYYSPVWKKMLGYEEYEIAGTFEEWESRVHPEDLDRVQTILTDHLASRLPEYQAEYRLRHKNGNYRWVLSHGLSQRDAMGKLIRMAGSHIDVTEAKEKGELLETFRHTLHERTTSLAKVAERGGQVFWLIQLDPLRVTYVSPSCERVWGLPAETLCRDPRFWISRIHVEDRKRTCDSFEAFVSGAAGDYCVDYRIRGCDGAIRWLHNECARLTNKAGDRNTICIVAQDITQSKTTEEALRESEGRFRLLADAAPVMIWMSGPDKGCTYFNRRWLEFTGRSLDRELGNGWADNVHPDDLATCLETYSRAFDARSRFSMEYRLLRHDGEYRWMWDKGVPREEPAGGFAGYVGSCVDITDKKRLEIEQRDLSRRLISAQETERTGIARELHDDIGQQVALLEVNLDRLAERAKRWAKKDRDLIQELRQQTKSIGSGVQHISHQLHPSKLTVLGLSASVAGFCREIDASGRLHVQALIRNIPASLPKDVALCLYRVVQESVSNILKHSRARRAKVALFGKPNMVCLRVSDRGAGFEPMMNGTNEGLGLISMRERVNMVGGDMRISSRPSRGTCIEVRVPLNSSVPARGKEGILCTGHES